MDNGDFEDGIRPLPGGRAVSGEAPSGRRSTQTEPGASPSRRAAGQRMARFDWVTSVLQDLSAFADLNDLARLRHDIDVVRRNWALDLIDGAAKPGIDSLAGPAASRESDSGSASIDAHEGR